MGSLSDNLGRKFVLTVNAVVQTVVSSLFYFCGSLKMLTTLRVGLGFCFGLGLPLTATTLVEHLPVKQRGRWVVLLNLCVTFGKLLGVALGYWFLDSLSTGNWRLMVASTCVLPATTVISSLFLRESPRFCLFNGQASQCYSALRVMQRVNFSFPHTLLLLENDCPLSQSKP